jgi:hypothetical protein
MSDGTSELGRTANGLTQLPVFRAKKSGKITIALVDPATGKTSFLKVKVTKKKK